MDETPVFRAARDYTSRGWSVIPIPFRQKAPTFRGWTEIRPGELDLPRLFNGGSANIGVLLGKPSGGLVDVDLDSQHAVRVAPRILPPTGVRFGRRG